MARRSSGSSSVDAEPWSVSASQSVAGYVKPEASAAAPARVPSIVSSM